MGLFTFGDIKGKKCNVKHEGEGQITFIWKIKADPVISNPHGKLESVNADLIKVSTLSNGEVQNQSEQLRL